MGARMVPANGQTTKTKKIFYMLFCLERLSILLQIHVYTFARNFCSRKGVCASIGYRASIGTYTVYIYDLTFIFSHCPIASISKYMVLYVTKNKVMSFCGSQNKFQWT